VFYIVEEESKLKSLENLVRLGCYVDVISTNDSYHPKLTDVVAVYVRLLKSDHGYIIPVNHEEGLNVDKTRIYEVLSKASKLYTLNKKTLLYYFNLQDAIDVSLLHSMTKYERLEYSKDSNVLNFFYNKFRTHKNINQLIPIAKLYEAADKLYDSIKQ